MRENLCVENGLCVAGNGKRFDNRFLKQTD